MLKLDRLTIVWVILHGLILELIALEISILHSGLLIIELRPRLHISGLRDHVWHALVRINLIRINIIGLIRRDHSRNTIVLVHNSNWYKIMYLKFVK